MWIFSQNEKLVVVKYLFQTMTVQIFFLQVLYLYMIAALLQPPKAHWGFQGTVFPFGSGFPQYNSVSKIVKDVAKVITQQLGRRLKMIAPWKVQYGLKHLHNWFLVTKDNFKAPLNSCESSTYEYKHQRYFWIHYSFDIKSILLRLSTVKWWRLGCNSFCSNCIS